MTKKLGAPGVFSADLRDAFAMAALQGLVASEENTIIDIQPDETMERAMDRNAERRAEWCYRQADAMLRVRARNEADDEG